MVPPICPVGFARLGFDILTTLAWFVATVLLGLTIQMVVVYPLALVTIGRMNPLFFFRATL